MSNILKIGDGRDGSKAIFEDFSKFNLADPEIEIEDFWCFSDQAIDTWRLFLRWQNLSGRLSWNLSSELFQLLLAVGIEQVEGAVQGNVSKLLQRETLISHKPTLTENTSS